MIDEIVDFINWYNLTDIDAEARLSSILEKSENRFIYNMSVFGKDVEFQNYADTR